MKNLDAPLPADLFIALSNAQTLESIGDAVKNYCSSAFHSSGAAILMEREGDLERAWQWQPRQLSSKILQQNVSKKGPAFRVFQTGMAEFRLRRLTPGCRDGALCFLPLRSPSQGPIGVLAISFRRNHEFGRAMREHLGILAQIVSDCIARVRAESTVKSQDEMLSALSHELKNPMTPIMGWAVALSSECLSAERQTRALDIIVRNVRALNYLIEDMFDAARVSSGKLHLRTCPTRIQEVAREALTVIQPGAESKRLRISTEISEAVPPFVADPHRLRQVVVNLLNNAVKFTPAGGTISLKIVRRREKVECTVSDNGRGIDPAFLPFVFDRFRQENRGPRPKAGGLGLGLAIVRQIVVLHGGTIQAYSKGPDRGAMFTVRLPLRRGHINDASLQRPAVAHQHA